MSEGDPFLLIPDILHTIAMENSECVCVREREIYPFHLISCIIHTISFKKSVCVFVKERKNIVLPRNRENCVCVCEIEG